MSSLNIHFLNSTDLLEACQLNIAKARREPGSPTDGSNRGLQSAHELRTEQTARRGEDGGGARGRARRSPPRPRAAPRPAGIAPRWPGGDEHPPRLRQAL